MRSLLAILAAVSVLFLCGCEIADAEGDPSPSPNPTQPATTTPSPNPTQPGTTIPPANPPPSHEGGRVIDHTCTDIEAIPAAWIEAAREGLHVLYGHTSHGRQITAGLDDLDAFMDGNGLYAMSQDGDARPEHSLDFRDEESFANANDLGSPDRVAWAADTRTYLDAHPQINLVLWSWCGQVAYSTEEEIDTYLGLMNGLEAEYPDVAFVYMTGHLDGSGLEGDLHRNNERIRAYCAANGKWLFDFADIESYDPDGVYFGDRYPTDAGNYDYDRDGETEQEDGETGDPIAYCHPDGEDRNWAEDWMAAHPGEWYLANDRWENGYHAPTLIANLKGYAAWWLFASVAGWGE